MNNDKERHRYWLCSRYGCGAVMDVTNPPQNSEWRDCRTFFQHKCPDADPNCGHWEAVKVDQKTIEILAENYYRKPKLAAKLEPVPVDLPKGLEDAVRRGLGLHYSMLYVYDEGMTRVDMPKFIHCILAAVQPLFDAQQKRHDTWLHNDAYQIKLLQSDNADLVERCEGLERRITESDGD